jgi:large repetitive protein
MPVESNRTESERINRHKARVIFANYVIEQTGVLLQRQITAELIGGSGAALEESAYTPVVEGAVYTTAEERDAYQASVGGVVITTPSAPTNVTAVAGARQATVSWTAPSVGGSISSYTVTSSPGNFTATSTTTSATVTGLSNNTSYTFTVTATNAAGTSPASSASPSVTTATVPGVPTGVTAVPGDAQAVVSFTAPASTGGSPITSYRVTASAGGGAGATGTSSPITITGLLNGTSTTFFVTATNAAGTSGLSSPSPAVTPNYPNGSVSFNGTSSYGSWSGYTPGSAAVTVECFFYCTSFASSKQFILGGIYPGVAQTAQLVISITSTTSILIERANGGTTNSFTVPTMSTNTWYHLVYVRASGGTATVFLAGTRSSTGTVTDNTSYIYSSGIIGASRPLSDLAISGNFSGYISNFRIVGSSSIYDPTASTITVPTTNLTVVGGANTAILLNTRYSVTNNPSIYFKDSSTYNYTLSGSSLTSITASPF